MRLPVATSVMVFDFCSVQQVANCFSFLVVLARFSFRTHGSRAFSFRRAHYYFLFFVEIPRSVCYSTDLGVEKLDFILQLTYTAEIS